MSIYLHEHVQTDYIRDMNISDHIGKRISVVAIINANWAECGWALSTIPDIADFIIPTHRPIWKYYCSVLKPHQRRYSKFLQLAWELVMSASFFPMSFALNGAKFGISQRIYLAYKL